MNAVRVGLMAVGATIVAIGAALLLEAASFDSAIADCAFAVVIATGSVMAVDFLL